MAIRLFCLASKFVTGDRQDARNWQLFIPLTVVHKLK